MILQDHSLELQKKVIFVGGTYGEKKKKLLSESLYVAFPSRHEGFSLFALEALASGLPLVAFDIPGISWANKNVALKAKNFNIVKIEKLKVYIISHKVLFFVLFNYIFVFQSN